MNKEHILKTFKKINERNWDTLYWAVDIHDTMIKSNYSTTELPKEFFPHAKEVMQRLSNRTDCVLILFTCSHNTEIKKYLELFEANKINFKFVNENPDVPNTALGSFDEKFYTNFYLDDKAGFDPETNWLEINQALDILDTQGIL
jgi:hypothetical protein